MTLNKNLQKDLKSIIFDFDGTLVDSEPVWKQVFKEIFQEEHKVELTIEIMWKNTGMGVSRSINNISSELALELDEETVKATALKINDETHARIHETLPLRPGAIDLMEWAANKDINMGICSASDKEMLSYFVENRGLGSFISEIISTYGTPREEQKPSPIPYQRALNALGANVHETLAIEDSPAGVQSSLSAGINTVAIKSDVDLISDAVSKLNPTVQVADFQELLQLLSSEN